MSVEEAIERLKTFEERITVKKGRAFEDQDKLLFAKHNDSDLDEMSVEEAIKRLKTFEERIKGWKVWSTNSDHVVFPSLQELLIINCPRLVEISTEALPSQRVLEIKRCGYGVLQSVVHNASSITKLELESISGLTDE
nr:NB-ARC domains-containing protein [Tanacetum cinerariifolium]